MIKQSLRKIAMRLAAVCPKCRGSGFDSRTLENCPMCGGTGSTEEVPTSQPVMPTSTIEEKEFILTARVVSYQQKTVMARDKDDAESKAFIDQTDVGDDWDEIEGTGDWEIVSVEAN